MKPTLALNSTALLGAVLERRCKCSNPTKIPHRLSKYVLMIAPVHWVTSQQVLWEQSLQSKESVSTQPELHSCLIMSHEWKHLKTREQKRRREIYQREPTVEAAESSRGETTQKKESIRAAELHVSSSRLIGRRAAGVPRRRSSEVKSPPTHASEQKSYLCRGTIRPACKLFHCRQHARLIQQ